MFIDIGFYKVYDFNIVFFYNNLIVRKMDEEYLYGICFINWNIWLGEKIYICVIEIYLKLLGFMDFGLINYDFVKIVWLLVDYFYKLCKDKGSKFLEYVFDFNDVFCFILSGDFFCVFINDVIYKIIDVKVVLIGRYVWFFFDLFGKIRVIEIIMNELKKKVYYLYI